MGKTKAYVCQGIVSISENKSLGSPGKESHLASGKQSTVLLHIHIILSYLSLTKSNGGDKKGSRYFPYFREGKNGGINWLSDLPKIVESVVGLIFIFSMQIDSF